MTEIEMFERIGKLVEQNERLVSVLKRARRALLDADKDANWYCGDELHEDIRSTLELARQP